MNDQADHRMLTVPESLAGERVDAAVARLFGLSRTRAADLIAARAWSRSTGPVAKSDRVLPGAVLEVRLPVRSIRSRSSPEVVEGI